MIIEAKIITLGIVLFAVILTVHFIKAWFEQKQ